MLNIYFGDMPEVIYNTSTYFKNTYNKKWITTDLVREMVHDVDKSEVVSDSLIQSPVFGPMPPTQLSVGVKTLILIAYDKKYVFNASNCGDNCAKWLLKIAEMRSEKSEKVVINLRHLMDFGNGEFKIRVLNTNKIVKNMGELIAEAVDYV